MPSPLQITRFLQKSFIKECNNQHQLPQMYWGEDTAPPIYFFLGRGWSLNYFTKVYEKDQPWQCNCTVSEQSAKHAKIPTRFALCHWVSGTGHLFFYNKPSQTHWLITMLINGYVPYGADVLKISVFCFSHHIRCATEMQK